MRVLDLFSGIGGMSLGLSWAGMTTVAFCEIDTDLHPILRHHWPGIPIFHDVRELTAEHLRDIGPVDVIAGGFPCQDVSIAGKGAGLSGSRSGLWWEMWRLCSELKPRWVLAENVPALRTRGYDTVAASLEELGYSIVEPCVVGAAHVGATHKRERVWIVAHDLRVRQQRPHEQSEWGLRTGHGCEVSAPDKERRGQAESRLADADCGTAPAVTPMERGSGMVAAESIQSQPVCSGAVDDADARPAERRICPGWDELAVPGSVRWVAGPDERQFDWEAPRLLESNMGLTTHGLSRRMALKALGNAVVPQVVACVGRAVLRLDEILKSGEIEHG